MVISSWAPGIQLLTFTCLIGWLFLAYRNFRNRLYIFALACLFSSFAYFMAMWEYYVIFWVDKTHQTDRAMFLLFLRMLFHFVCVLIFNSWYKAMPNLRKSSNQGFLK